jgi:hypothetical protein
MTFAGLPGLAWLNIAAKLALAGLILFYFARPDLPQFEGKVMPLRTAFYPLAATLVPALWWLRGAAYPYPHLPDIMIVASALTDYGGNAADMYRFEYFDHTVHFVNMFMLTVAFGAAMAAHGLPRWALAGLTLGFGSVLHTIWEITEYSIVAVTGAGLDVTASTTIRDFAVGLVGSSIGAALAYAELSRRPGLGGALLGGHMDVVAAETEQREKIGPVS